jgi:hypothetical protein
MKCAPAACRDCHQQAARAGQLIATGIVVAIDMAEEFHRASG